MTYDVQGDSKMNMQTEDSLEPESMNQSYEGNLNLKDINELTVSDLMTECPFTVMEDDNLRIADELMKWRSVRHIPVVNHRNHLVGLITHRDILKISISSLAGIDNNVQEEINRGVAIKNIMRSQVASVPYNTPLTKAAKMMFKHKYGCLPIIKNNELVGIITEADFVRFFVEWDVFRNKES